MGTNLTAQLGLIEDFRTTDGRRHPLWLVLLLVIMATMSGYLGYRAIGRFVQKHQVALVGSFQIPKARVPSYSTIRRVLMGIDFDQFAKVFNAWAKEYSPHQPQEWVAVDGKSISSTVSNYAQSYQNFVSIVSVFSQARGVVLHMQQLHNKQASEIATVQALLTALDLQGVVLSLDALHCQKKRCS